MMIKHSKIMSTQSIKTGNGVVVGKFFFPIIHHFYILLHQGHYMVRQCPQIHRLQYNPLKSCNIIPNESHSATHQNASRFSRRIIALPGVISF